MSLDKKMKELREDGIGVERVSCNKFMDEMKGGKKICKNARLMTDRVQAKYSCGCSHIVFIQPDNVNQNMNVEVPFVCKNCPKGVPIQLTIHKTKYSIKNSPFTKLNIPLKTSNKVIATSADTHPTASALA